jgi:hypothetical protein
MKLGVVENAAPLYESLGDSSGGSDFSNRAIDTVLNSLQVCLGRLDFSITTIPLFYVESGISIIGRQSV